MSRRGRASPKSSGKSNKKDFDARFDAFLKESISSEESFDSAKISKFLEPGTGKANKNPWWMNDDEDDDDIGANFGSGLTASGKSFIKKKQPAHSTPIRDEDKPGSVFNLDKTSDDKKANGDKPTKSPDKPTKTKGKKEMKTRTSRGKGDASMSKDSLEDISEKSEEDSAKDRAAKLIDSSVESGKTETPHKPGIDTMDEMRDKEKFFRDLERNVDGTIDYGRLNQELSQTGTTLSPEGAAKTAATLGTLQDINEDEINTKSRHLTNQNTEEQDPSQKRPSMLSKVSLMDSLESTMNTTTSPKIGQGTLQDAKEELDEVDGVHEIGHTHVGTKTGTGFMGTNTSQEIEALHKALREVGLSPTIKTDSQHFDNSFFGNKSTSEHAELLQKILNGETDQRTGKQRNVEDILQEMEQIENRSKHAADDEYDEHLYDRHRSPKSPKSPKELERQRQVEEEADEMRGFDLSPVHDSARGGYDSARGFEQSHTEDTEMYQPVTQVSVTERGRSKKKESREKDTEQETTRQSPRKSSRRKRSPGESPMRSLSPRESTKRRGSPRRSTSKGDNRSNSMSPHKPDNRSRSFSPAKTGTTMKPKFAHVKSSGYGKKSPSKPSSARDRIENEREGKHTAKYSKTWSPADVTRQKIKGSVSPTFHKDIHEKLKEEDVGRISQLRASVDSFAQYITDHFSASKDIPEVKYSTEEPAMSATWKGEKSGAEDLMVEGNKQWQDQWKEEKRLNSVLKSDLMAMEREYQRKLETQKLEFEEQIFNLKQENFVLGAKLPDSESVLKKKLGSEGLSNMSKEQLEKLEKEMTEQETLLAGYQQENKRLYDELKNVTKQTKQTEARMFKENQKMAVDIANLKTQLERKEEQLKSKGVITSLPAQQNIAAGNTPDGVLGAGRIAHLESEVKEARRQEEIAKREFQLLQKSKKELEQHIDQLIKEREALRHKVEESKTLKSDEAQALEDKYVKEIERLNRKLKWYAENQKLLDADAKVLKQKEEEILKYKLRVEELQTETGKKMEENKMRSKERATDAKKIQDLQRQVKEMEQIIRRRHPNSLPALMMTAAVAPDDTGMGKTPSVVVLENRMKKLEMELESKDQEANKMIRAVEQKYNNIKTQYEDRIKDLEIQLAIYKRPDDGALNIYDHPHTHAAALQKEMDSMREKYKRQVLELQAEVSKLNFELNKPKKGIEVALKNELQASRDTETELRKQLKSLQLEVENKSHELQVTNKSLERLRKEKTTTMMNGVNDLDKNKKQKGKGKNKGNIEEEADSGNIFVNNDREYEPQSFADKTHISDLLKENLYLKSQVEQLQLEVDHGKLDLRKSLAESESMTRKSREHFEEQIEALRSSHQKELQRILADQALEYSASKTAELQSKVDAQQVMIKHLKDQLSKSELDGEQLSVLKIREASLNTQIDKLKDELRDAKKFHTPEMKHFEAIQEKILQMEKRHERREEEMQQIIRNAKHVATVQLDQESHKWKKVVEDKNLEIQKFRTELDSILEVLRLLQKQGVVIPVSSQVT